MILNPPIVGFAVRVSGCPIPWLPDHYLLSVLHFNDPTPFAEVHFVRPDGTHTIVGRSDTLRKDDSAWPAPKANGGVILFVSEAGVAGGGGATSEIHANYEWPNVIPPYTPPTAVIDQVARDRATVALQTANAAAAHASSIVQQLTEIT